MNLFIDYKLIRLLRLKMTKLHFYKARDVNIVVILRGHKKTEWEMIRWDLDTDTFTEGQWLRNKHLDPKSAAISPNGEYFVYGYDVYGKGWQSVGVASKVPYFTADYFQEYTGGRIWFPSTHFDEHGRLVDTGTTAKLFQPMNEPFEIIEQYKLRNPDTTLEKVNDFILVKLNRPNQQYQIHSSIIRINSGYAHQSFTDPKGRLITSEEGKLFADGELLYDTTDHVFRCVEKDKKEEHGDEKVDEKDDEKKEEKEILPTVSLSSARVGLHLPEMRVIASSNGLSTKGTKKELAMRLADAHLIQLI